ncbi:MAG: DUF72 domain-containing protein [Anaerolineae bacterium]|nr:DUF72 domain-containing protein [Anaerolineae bacterium]
MNRGRFFVGTSGWSYSHWRGLFYPAGMPQRDWFTHYARYFPSVEVNYTFYRLPPEQTFGRWKQQSPEGFIYALKAPRVITHLRKLSQVEEPVKRFLERARGLEENLGPILYQLPPNWRCDVPRLADFLALLPSDLRHVVEFRDTSWHNDEVFQLLGERNVGYCYADGPGFDCPLLVTGSVAYARMHGVGVKYGGCYSRRRLRRLAVQIGDFLARGCDTFVYFNNDAQAYAVENAYDLLHLVRETRGG